MFKQWWLGQREDCFRNANCCPRWHFCRNSCCKCCNKMLNVKNIFMNSHTSFVCLTVFVHVYALHFCLKFCISICIMCILLSALHTAAVSVEVHTQAVFALSFLSPKMCGCGAAVMVKAAVYPLHCRDSSVKDRQSVGGAGLRGKLWISAMKSGTPPLAPHLFYSS